MAKYVENEYIKEWMEDVIDVNKDMMEIETYSDRIELCGISAEIHVYKGIEFMAEAVGAELNIQEREDEYYCVYFEYDDTKFFQLKEREADKNVD